MARADGGIRPALAVSATLASRGPGRLRLLKERPRDDEAIEEMTAFLLQRFSVRHGNGLSERFNCRRNSMLPFDSMGIKGQLMTGRVIKDGHFLRPDNDQTLLLEGMKPTHIDMCLDSAGEFEMAHGNVVDISI